MERKIIWTERASSDIEAIVRYIARRDPSAANRIGLGIFDRHKRPEGENYCGEAPTAPPRLWPWEKVGPTIGCHERRDNGLLLCWRTGGAASVIPSVRLFG